MTLDRDDAMLSREVLVRGRSNIADPRLPTLPLGLINEVRLPLASKPKPPTTDSLRGDMTARPIAPETGASKYRQWPAKSGPKNFLTILT